MAGDWLQIDLDLPEKRETQRIIDLTGESLEVVLGRLMLFWRWVERHWESSRFAGGNLSAVARVCGGDEKFWAALGDKNVGWLEALDDALFIPGFNKRFSKSAKRRALDARRKSAKRPQGVRTQAEQLRTERGARIEKNRIEKNTNTEEKKRGSRSPFNPLAVELPENLRSDSFAAHWQAWVKHRTEKKKLLTATSVDQQLKFLSELGEAGAIASLENSIRNGWAGVFEPDRKAVAGSGSQPKPLFDPERMNGRR